MPDAPHHVPPSRPLTPILWRLAGVIVLCTCIYIAVSAALHWAEQADLSPAAMGAFLFVMILIYAILMALPFVPSIEIALTIFMIRGTEIMPFIYAATVLGLLIAFFAGRYVLGAALMQLFSDLRLKRAAGFLVTLEDLSPDRKLALLRTSLPGWAGPYVVRFRYVLLACLLNLPGNVLIGGGGGICMVAGMTQVFRGPAVIATICIATAPVPLMIWYFGTSMG